MPLYAQLALLAVTMYALQNTIMEQEYLAKVNIWLKLGTLHLVTLGLSWYNIIHAYRQAEPLQWPTEWRGWAAMGFMMVSITLADASFFAAYEAGGKAVHITLIVATMPAMAAVFSWFLGGALPTWRHVLAWVLIVTAVWLVASSPQPQS